MIHKQTLTRGVQRGITHLFDGVCYRLCIVVRARFYCASQRGLQEVDVSAETCTLVAETLYQYVCVFRFREDGMKWGSNIILSGEEYCVPGQMYEIHAPGETGVALIRLYTQHRARPIRISLETLDAAAWDDEGGPVRVLLCRGAAHLTKKRIDRVS